ncbi:MAG: hypothetical protein F4128_10770 [Gammaproteobacteria bacterium]|nr:hypothetical protein [Gammaproteobacteria bacterium]
MNTSSESPGFLPRLFRSITSVLCHPLIAWNMFLLLVCFYLLVLWSVQQFLDMRPGQIQTFVRFHSDFLDSQDVMVKELEKTLMALPQCQ